MLILISPAKTLDYQSPLATERYTQPELLAYSQQLIHEARKLSAPQIASRCWPSKVTSTLACKQKRLAKPISILPSSICACYPACTGCCARWI